VPAGEAFTNRQQQDIQRMISIAERESGLLFSVYVGTLEGDTAAHARLLHAALGESEERTVLIAVDPGGRHLEIVTGHEAARRLDDRSCGLAAMSMATSFSAGDLTGGIGNGILSLAEHARRPRSLHTDGV
jgi:uncharacterized membrane protein YgcG